MSTRHNITDLIVKKLLGRISNSEEQQLNFWLGRSENKDLYNELLELDSASKEIEFIEYCNSRKSVVKDDILNRHRSSRFIGILKYAAVIILPIIITSVFFLTENTVPEESKLVAKNTRTCPVLKLPSGKKAQLKTSFNIELDNSLNIKNDNGVVNFQVKSEKKLANKLSTIEIPVGCEYKLKLSDGTYVHIDANSKLTFPAVFTGKTRTVYLEGHAYFDVAHNKEAPFIVKCKNMNIKVHGTKFDIESYEDEPDVRATLAEGSIEADVFGKGRKLLVPNQQVCYNKIYRNLNVKNVDAREILQWRNGYFWFNGNSLEYVMNKLRMWYEFEVFWESEEAKSILIGLKFSKDQPLDLFIRQLEEAGRIKARIAGKSIFINIK